MANTGNSGPHPLTEGEIWVREQLALLRLGRSAPPAAWRFVLASWRRAAAVRSARPELAQRSYHWLAAGAAAWLVLAAAGIRPFRRRLGVGLAWWAATGLMLDWHLGMLETHDGRTRQLGPADALTLVRAWLVPVAADSPTALVCAAAAATDVLDGQLARRVEPTRAGRDLEGLVDTCFLLAALSGLSRRGQLGRVPALAEGGRVAIGFGYSVFMYLGRARAPENELIHAARRASSLRGGALIAAAAGRRRLAEVMLFSATLWSTARLARAARA